MLIDLMTERYGGVLEIVGSADFRHILENFKGFRSFSFLYVVGVHKSNIFANFHRAHWGLTDREARKMGYSHKAKT